MYKIFSLVILVFFCNSIQAETIVYGSLTNPTNITGSVDGRFEGLVIENSQANTSASTNETAGIKFSFGGIDDVARISADKLKDYTSASEEESRIAFWVDIGGVPTMVAHFMPDGLMLMLGDSRIRFAGTAGGGGQSIQYKDSSGSNRAALLFPGSDIVALVNRTEDGVVEIRANTSTGGAGGESTIAIFDAAIGIDLVSGRIKFPGTQSAASDVNTLDDYKEGTFTPTVVFAAGSGTITYTTQEGQYTKIGNIIFFSLDLQTLSIASRTGSMKIAGLPFTSSSIKPGSSVHVGSASGLVITAGMNVLGNIGINSATIDMRLWDATTGSSNLLAAEWTDNGQVILSGHYFISTL